MWTGAVVAFVFTSIPAWTTWMVLGAMAVYDLFAVLTPHGPLQMLVNLAIERDQDIPALVYEAREVQRPRRRPAAAAPGRRDPAADAAASVVGTGVAMPVDGGASVVSLGPRRSAAAPVGEGRETDAGARPSTPRPQDVRNGHAALGDVGSDSLAPDSGGTTVVRITQHLRCLACCRS